MNILFTNDRLGYAGGAEKNIAHVAAGLKRRGHRVYFAYGARGSVEPEKFAALFDGVFETHVLGGDPDTPSLADIVRSVGSQTVYMHRVSPVGVAEQLPNSVRLVRMVHDHDMCCPRRHKYFAYSGRVCDRPVGAACFLDCGFLRRCDEGKLKFSLSHVANCRTELRASSQLDALLVASSYMKRELVINGIRPSLVKVLPPAVPFPERRQTSSPAGHTILFAGQLVKGKGVDLLLRALNKVGGNWDAKIVGAGSDLANLTRLASGLGLSDRVEFVGRVGSEELSNYYDAARVVVVPSRWPEPFGMVGLEAMHHQRPVVAFDVGGISEWLFDGINGSLVPEQDIDVFAAALTEILLNDVRAAGMGASGKKIARNLFSFDSYLTALENQLSIEDTSEVRNAV